MTTIFPANLSETLNSLGDAAREVAVEVRADKEQRAAEIRSAAVAQQRYNRRSTALLIIVAVLVACLVTLALTNRRMNQNSAKTNTQNAQIIQEIRSCTTAGGACYEQNAKRTQEVAAGLLRSNIAVAVCARTAETEEALLECVEARLTQPSEAEEPPPSGEGPDGTPIPGETPN